MPNEITAYLCPCGCHQFEEDDSGPASPGIQVSPGQVLAGLSPAVKSRPAQSRGLAYLKPELECTGDKSRQLDWSRSHTNVVSVSYQFPEDCAGSLIMPQQPPHWGSPPPDFPRWKWEQVPIDGAIAIKGEPAPSSRPETGVLELKKLSQVPGSSFGAIDKFWSCEANGWRESPLLAGYFATRTMTGGYITQVLGDRGYLVRVRGAEHLAVSSDYQSYNHGDWVFLAVDGCRTPDHLCGVKSPRYNLHVSNRTADLLDSPPFVIVPLKVGFRKFCREEIWDYPGQTEGSWDGLLDAYVLKTYVSNINHEGCESGPPAGGDFGEVLGFSRVPIKYVRQGAAGFNGGSCIIANGESVLVLVANGIIAEKNLIIFSVCRPCPDPAQVTIIGPVQIEYGRSATYRSSDKKLYGWSLTSGPGSLAIPYGIDNIFTAPSAGPAGARARIKMFCVWDPTIIMEEIEITFGCESAVILYSTLTQPVGSQQTLRSSNGKFYRWSITSGGGTLNTAYGAQAVLTSPAANPDCAANATIRMYDDVGCIDQSIKIAFDGYPYSSDNGAYLRCSGAQCYYGHSCWWASATYSCKDVHLANKDNPSYYQCGYYPPANCTANLCNSCTHVQTGQTCSQFLVDIRTENMKNLGCCPGILA